MSAGLPRVKPPSGLKTFSHLEHARRVPSDYQIASSALLWYPQRGGFEVEVPLGGWYAQYQRASPLRCDDWERFIDPRETTYAKYVSLEQQREANAESIVRLIDEKGYDASLSTEWLDTLERVLPPAKYPAHAMQMMAAYIGQMAPAGRIVIACAFQAADEVRKIQRIVQRTVQLRRTCARFGESARTRWERDPAWQPWRELVERALIVWDWGEALVALGLCIGPLFDAFMMTRLPEVATRRADPMLAPFLGSLEEDCVWHRAWTHALFAMALSTNAENKAVIESWLATWLPRARAAVRALDALVAPDAVAEGAIASHDEWLASLGLNAP